MDDFVETVGIAIGMMIIGIFYAIGIFIAAAIFKFAWLVLPDTPSGFIPDFVEEFIQYVKEDEPAHKGEHKIIIDEEFKKFLEERKK